jgi:hypothetical protein
MTLKTCLRCDWQGETNEPMCPNCGERPLYVIGAASPPEGAAIPARANPAERSRETASTESKAPSGTPSISATPPDSQMDAGGASGRSRRSTAAFVLAALVLIVALGIWFNAHEDRSASAGSTDTAVTEAPASDSSASHPTAAPSIGSQSQASGDGTKRAHVGGSVTLSGNQEGLMIDVMVVQVVDPARATNSVFGPRKGYHFLAVQLELTNSGTTTYSDTPAKGAALIDNKLHQYDADITDPVGPGFGSPKIAPGENRAGYITFEVPDGRTPIIFQFRLDSGFGRGGLWSL